MAEDKNEALLKQAAERFKHIHLVDKEERELADYDLRFAINKDNCQWPEKVRRLREDANPPRPCISINKILIDNWKFFNT